MEVQSGLCQTLSETQKTAFFITRLKLSLKEIKYAEFDKRNFHTRMSVKQPFLLNLLFFFYKCYFLLFFFLFFLTRLFYLTINS